MSDFDSIRKRLDYAPVVQDTTLVKKPLSFEPVEDIKKLRQQIVIPTISIDISAFNFGSPLIIYQWNYSVSTTFRISNFNSLQSSLNKAFFSYPNIPNFGLCVCLRYRLNANVTRIFISGSPDSANQSLSYLQEFYRNYIIFESFNNQKIPLNFSIELWYFLYAYAYIGAPIAIRGLKEPCYINTSITKNPDSADDNINTQILSLQTATFANLSNVLPEILPIVPNTNGPWLTN